MQTEIACERQRCQGTLGRAENEQFQCRHQRPLDHVQKRLVEACGDGCFCGEVV
jgi:hypothetical protein